MHVEVSQISIPHSVIRVREDEVMDYLTSGHEKPQVWSVTSWFITCTRFKLCVKLSSFVVER